MLNKELNIIGGGLAGCEAAWQAANLGIKVNIYEMRDATYKTPAHQTDNLAELVCSNSLRSDDINSAIGLLHEEMRRLNSLIMKAANIAKVPAGSALAVDRELFSQIIQEHIEQHPKITVIRKKITELPKEGHWIIATGPLTDEALMQDIMKYTGSDKLAFFDAIAPIVYKDTIDFSKAWFQSRYDKGDGKDYINCPLTKEQYYQFVDDLLSGEKTEFKEWEKNTPYFDGCLPIEVMAERGRETLSFGPMKPVGLTNPYSEEKPYAVVQLRQDNKLGTIYNIVGFQTKLKYNAQQEIFKKIPGLENAEFARLGGIHRNSFINSPELLTKDLKLESKWNRHVETLVETSRKNLESQSLIFNEKDIDEVQNQKVQGVFEAEQRSVLTVHEHAQGSIATSQSLIFNEYIRFAGQVTGVEGYVESSACGLLAGIFAGFEILGRKIILPPHETALGALLNHITGDAESTCFQPMNINFGLFPPLNKRYKKTDRKAAYSKRALEILDKWIISLKH